MRDPRTLRFGRLEVAPRHPERFQLACGLPVHALEDHDLPVASFGLCVRAGGVYDPPALTGLASMTATALRLGGSRARPGDAMDEALDHLGADIDVSAEDDAMTIKAWCLKRHIPAVLDLLAGLIRTPAFPAAKVSLTRSREIELLQRRWDQPSSTAALLFRREVYGADSPWGRLETVGSAGRIGRTDLVGAHRRHVGPRTAVLAAAGAFKTAELSRRLERIFAGWTSPARPAPPPSSVTVTHAPRVILVPRQVGQANFRIGHLGIKFGDPDQYSLRIMDMILGNGSLNTRLFRDIRTERGLAYAIWSRLHPRVLDVGTFAVGGETKYESLGEAVETVLGHLIRLQNEPVEEAEIKRAKDNVDHGFAFEFQSAWDIAWREASYEYNGLPPRLLFEERERLLAVTPGDVRRAARTHLHPKRALILVVGDPSRCRETLKRFGRVRDIPPPA